MQIRASEWYLKHGPQPLITPRYKGTHLALSRVARPESTDLGQLQVAVGDPPNEQMSGKLLKLRLAPRETE